MKCEICKEVDIPNPEYCCSGWMCGCMGMPVEPPFCYECHKKTFESEEQRQVITKFRAWNVRRFMKENEVVILGNGNLLFLDKETDSEYVKMNDLNVKVSYYTGLRDKNGIEICGGDILTAKNHGKQVVTFEKGMFKFGTMSLCTFTNVGTEFWCEIIGNIYENPDLLKD